MKSFKPIIALLLLSVLLIQIIPITTAQTNATNIRIQLNGPPVLGVLDSGEYTATVIDPDDREWDYQVWITATNDTGASPLKELPVNGTLSSGNDTFMFNITAMQKAGTLDIHVNCTSGTLYYEKVQPITVVTPIVFNVDINNPTNVEINNATVQFLIDGVEIDRQSAVSIPARDTLTVSTDWITAEKEPGWHDSTIIVDLNNDGVIDKDVGDMLIEDRFYIEGGSDLAFNLTVLIGILALIVGMFYISKRKIR